MKVDVNGNLCCEFFEEIADIKIMGQFELNNIPPGNVIKLIQLSPECALKGFDEMFVDQAYRSLGEGWFENCITREAVCFMFGFAYEPINF